MKIHRTKKKCGNTPRQPQERTDLSDKSSEDISQVANHSVDSFYFETSDEQFLKLTEKKTSKDIVPSSRILRMGEP